ncbi:hypothetical protein DTW90_28160 [Neorhizobium sp. P12A]|nr:hypothetical protein DTW90_28160 [Neorhizobium sp. P12A]
MPFGPQVLSDPGERFCNLDDRTNPASNGLKCNYQEDEMDLVTTLAACFAAGSFVFVVLTLH